MSTCFRFAVEWSLYTANMRQVAYVEFDFKINQWNGMHRRTTIEDRSSSDLACHVIVGDKKNKVEMRTTGRRRSLTRQETTWIFNESMWSEPCRRTDRSYVRSYIGAIRDEFTLMFPIPFTLWLPAAEYIIKGASFSIYRYHWQHAREREREREFHALTSNRRSNYDWWVVAVSQVLFRVLQARTMRAWPCRRDCPATHEVLIYVSR